MNRFRQAGNPFPTSFKGLQIWAQIKSCSLSVEALFLTIFCSAEYYPTCRETSVFFSRYFIPWRCLTWRFLNPFSLCLPWLKRLGLGELYHSRWWGSPRHTESHSRVKVYKMGCTANEGLVRIQYKCLVPIYVFQKWNCAASLFPKQNYNVLSPNPHTHMIGLSILLQPNMWTDPGNI